MKKFSSNQYFKARIGVVDGLFKVTAGDVEFELESLSLTVDMIKELKTSESLTYDEILNQAAEYGLAFDERRACDNEDLIELSESIWEAD